MSTSIIIADMKELVGKGDLETLQHYFEDIHGQVSVPWDFVYKAVYLHACLKKQHKIVEWLLELYKSFDEITAIALRQLFPYGRYLLTRGR